MIPELIRLNVNAAMDRLDAAYCDLGMNVAGTRWPEVLDALRRLDEAQLELAHIVTRILVRPPGREETPAEVSPAEVPSDVSCDEE